MTIASIFDIDGTLVTLKFDVQGTRRAIIAEASKRGFDTSELGLKTPTQHIIDAIRVQAAGRNQKSEFESLKATVYRILDEFEAVSSREASLFPGTVAVLDRLRSKGVLLAVLTNSGRRATSQVIGTAGIRDYFAFVLTRDDVTAMKPRPDGLQKAVSMLGITPGGVYYVGDSPFDIEAARGAGVKAVSVTTGNYGKDRLQAEGADYVIESIEGLPLVLGL